MGVGVTHLVQESDAEHERHDAERQVHQEHPAPAGLHQQPADGRAERGGRAADRGPQADGGALAGRAEGGKQQPERGGQHERTAGGLVDAGADEELEGRCDGAQGADAAAKTASPIRKARLRPARSDQRPAGTRTAAKTMV